MISGDGSESRSRNDNSNMNNDDDDDDKRDIKLFTASLTTLHWGIWARPDRCHDEAQDDLYQCWRLKMLTSRGSWELIEDKGCRVHQEGLSGVKIMDFLMSPQKYVCRSLTLCPHQPRKQWNKEPDPSSTLKPICSSPGTWSLTLSDGTSLADPQVVASGMPMEEPIRFVACMVEHSRSNDAEFQVLNKAAEATAAKTGQLEEGRSCNPAGG